MKCQGVSFEYVVAVWSLLKFNSFRNIIKNIPHTICRMHTVCRVPTLIREQHGYVEPSFSNPLPKKADAYCLQRAYCLHATSDHFRTQHGNAEHKTL